MQSIEQIFSDSDATYGKTQNTAEIIGFWEAQLGFTPCYSD